MSVSGVKCPSAVNSGADGDYREYCGKERRIETQSEVWETKPSLNEKQQFANHKTQQINHWK
jgi:hypothetical protein